MAGPTAAQQRATLIKPQQPGITATATLPQGKSPMTPDVAAALLLKRQQQQAKVTQMQVPPQGGLATTQIFTPMQIPAGTSSGTPVATLVKASNMRTAAPQQFRLNQLNPQILTQTRKVPGKAGVQQVIVQQQKSLPGMPMQPIQLMKQMPQTMMQNFTHVSNRCCI